MPDFDDPSQGPAQPAPPLDADDMATETPRPTPATRPMSVAEMKTWATEAQTANPFAPPDEAPKRLSFAEDSKNIPAPAPFDIVSQTASQELSSGPAAPSGLPLSSAATPATPTPPTTAPPAAETDADAVPMHTIAVPTSTPAATSPAVSPAAVSPAAVSPAQESATPTPDPTPDPTPAAAPRDAPPPYTGPPSADRQLAQAVDVMARLRARMRAQILGRDEVIDLILVALLADGHVLLEDFPGSGKTTLAKALGSSIVEQDAGDDIAEFRRIQFTPDLLPSDVTGVSVFDVNTSQFQFRRGPIFAHVVLADEINRTSPKVQSAMLEAMAEKQVTVDNLTYGLDPLFFVIATQNPLDLAGTYPLPVAQLDRFLFKIRMQHIDRGAELEVLNTYRRRRDVERQDLPKVARLDVLAARRAIDEHVAIEPAVKECLVDIAHTLRTDERVLQGNSTRSLVLLLPALQALATLRGRDFVSSEDIHTLIPRVMGHRVELAPGVNDLEQVLTEVMEGPIEALSRSTLRRR